MGDTFSHLDLWYETQQSASVNRMDPTKNPNTDLSSTPEEAEIDIQDGPTQTVTPVTFANRVDHPGVVSRFLIERAMLDPDATVRPIEQGS